MGRTPALPEESPSTRDGKNTSSSQMNFQDFYKCVARGYNEKFYPVFVHWHTLNIAVGATCSNPPGTHTYTNLPPLWHCQNSLSYPTNPFGILVMQPHGCRPEQVGKSKAQLLGYRRDLHHAPVLPMGEATSSKR